MKHKNKIIFYSLITIIALSALHFSSAPLNISRSLFAQDSVQNDQINPVSTSTTIEPQGRSDSLFVTFKQGGLLMWPILFLGILGFTIIIERIIYYYRNRIWKRDVLDKFVDDAISSSDAKFREELENEIQDAVQIYANKAERALALLNGIGNLAPVIGFFGTVQGMIGAFASIAAATSVSAKVVAVGIQVALITTAGGLSVAVPALAFFYLFSHLIQTMFARIDEITGEKIKHLPRYSDYEAAKGK